MSGDDVSVFESGGEVTGDGSARMDSEPRGRRGLGIRNGDEGTFGILPGEGWRCGEGT